MEQEVDINRWVSICRRHGCPLGYDSTLDDYIPDYHAALEAAEQSEPLAMQMIAAYIAERLGE